MEIEIQVYMEWTTFDKLIQPQVLIIILIDGRIMNKTSFSLPMCLMASHIFYIILITEEYVGFCCQHAF